MVHITEHGRRIRFTITVTIYRGSERQLKYVDEASAELQTLSRLPKILKRAIRQMLESDWRGRALTIQLLTSVLRATPSEGRGTASFSCAR